MTDEQAVEHGERVERFLADDAVKAAFARVEQSYIDSWRSAQTKETRETCWAKLAALDDVRSQLAATVGNGQMKRREIERKEKQRLAEQRRGQV